MTDFDSILRTQDEIRTVVNAVLGECDTRGTVPFVTYRDPNPGTSLPKVKVVPEPKPKK